MEIYAAVLDPTSPDNRHETWVDVRRWYRTALNLVLTCRMFHAEVLMVIAHIASAGSGQDTVYVIFNCFKPPPDPWAFWVPPLLLHVKHVRSTWHAECGPTGMSGKRKMSKPGIPIDLVRRRVRPWTRVTMVARLVQRTRWYSDTTTDVQSFEDALTSLNCDLFDLREYALGGIDGVEVEVELELRMPWSHSIYCPFARLKDGMVERIGNAPSRNFAMRQKVLDSIARVLGLKTKVVEDEE